MRKVREPSQEAIRTRGAWCAKAGGRLLLIAVLAMAALAQAVAHAAQRNMIFILVDDQRWDSMSAMDHPFLKTPSLDRLARGGAHFRNAFVTTSLCAPSRASILSGQYAHRHKVFGNGPPLPKGTATFPAELQKAGYETAFIGKWHMGRSSDEPRPGFDHWVSFPGQGVYTNPRFNINGERVKREGYITDLLTDYAVEFLERSHEKPFCLYLSHKAAHYEFKPAERHKDAYSDVTLTPPASMADTDANYQGKPAWVRAARDTVVGVDGMYWGQIPYDTFVRNFNRTLLAVDDSVGRLMQTLERLGLLESTLIVYTSDNGMLQGEHGLIDKRNMYEESIRVPLIVHCPEIVPAGQTREEMVLNIDIAPTLLDAAGVQASAAMQGKSFLPLARGEEIPWRESFLYEYLWEEAFPENPTVFGVRTPRWKYAWYYGTGDTREELYDLQADPHEMKNRATDKDARPALRSMRTELKRLMDEAGLSRVPSW